MNLRYKILALIIIFSSCKTNTAVSVDDLSSLRDLDISAYTSGDIRWNLTCNIARINEKENKIKCFNTKIITYSSGSITSEMKARNGYADLANKIFYLYDNAEVISYTEKVKILTDTINFDYKNNKIFSDKRTLIIRDNLKIDAMGFEAKSDLSNIKIKKHSSTLN